MSLSGCLALVEWRMSIRRATRFMDERSPSKRCLAVFLTDPGYVERFRREAHRIAALEHPSIVPMLQFIEQDRGLYVVMPLYAESLRDLLDRKQRLPLNEAARIVTEVGSALAVAHCPRTRPSRREAGAISCWTPTAKPHSPILVLRARRSPREVQAL